MYVGANSKNKNCYEHCRTMVLILLIKSHTFRKKGFVNCIQKRTYIVPKYPISYFNSGKFRDQDFFIHI